MEWWINECSWNLFGMCIEFGYPRTNRSVKNFNNVTCILFL